MVECRSPKPEMRVRFLPLLPRLLQILVSGYYWRRFLEIISGIERARAVAGGKRPQAQARKAIPSTPATVGCRHEKCVLFFVEEM